MIATFLHLDHRPNAILLAESESVPFRCVYAGSMRRFRDFVDQILLIYGWENQGSWKQRSQFLRIDRCVAARHGKNAVGIFTDAACDRIPRFPIGNVRDRTGVDDYHVGRLTVRNRVEAASNEGLKYEIGIGLIDSTPERLDSHRGTGSTQFESIPTDTDAQGSAERSNWFVPPQACAACRKLVQRTEDHLCARFLHVAPIGLRS